MQDLTLSPPPAATLPSHDLRGKHWNTSQVQNFNEYWVLLRKYWGTIVLVLVICASIAVVSIYKTEPVFSATAILRIQSQTPDITGVSSSFSYEGNNNEESDYYRTQLNLLQSRSLAARVIKDLHLETHPDFRGAETFSSWLRDRVSHGLHSVTHRARPASPPATEAPAPEAHATNDFELGVHPDLINMYLSMLNVSTVDRSQLVAVEATTPNAALSKAIANSHAAMFIRMSLETRFELTTEARQFLQDKLHDLKTKVTDSEEALNRFRRTNRITSLEKGENLLVERLMSLNRDLTDARSKRIEAESLYRVVQQQNNRLLSQLIDNRALQQLKDQVGSLQVERARMLTNLTPRHPAVVAIQAQLTQAQNRLNQEINRIVGTIESDYRAAVAKERALTDEMEREKQNALELQGISVQYAILEREAQSNRSLYEDVLKRTKESDLAGNVPVSNIQITDRAEIPVRPNGTNDTRTFLLSLIVGVLGGSAVAFARHQLDNTIKTPTDVEHYLGLPTIGLVPNTLLLKEPASHQIAESASATPVSAVDAGRTNDADSSPAPSPRLPLLIHFRPFSLITECYRLIRTAILFSRAGQPPQTILITSSLAGEGKTITAINVATSLTQLGTGPVLLIDADLRNGTCHQLLAAQKGPGLTHVLTGHANLNAAIQATAISDLFLLPAGGWTPNPAEILGSDKVRQALAGLRSRFAYIIIDSGPVLPIVDTVLLSTLVDGVVLVVRGEQISRNFVSKSRGRLDYVGAKILGVVLNGINVNNPEYREYRYSYVPSGSRA